MFRQLFTRLWEDEHGAVVALEYLMLGSIVAAGSVTGLVAMRDSMVSEFQEFGHTIQDVRQVYGPNLPNRSKPTPLTQQQTIGVPPIEFTSTP